MDSSLQKVRTARGFGMITALRYPIDGTVSRVVQESSLIGDSPAPGSSFLWIGESHHLNRNEVRDIVSSLQNWLERGRLVDAVKAEAKKKQ